MEIQTFPQTQCTQQGLLNQKKNLIHKISPQHIFKKGSFDTWSNAISSQQQNNKKKGIKEREPPPKKIKMPWKHRITAMNQKSKQSD